LVLGSATACGDKDGKKKGGKVVVTIDRSLAPKETLSPGPDGVARPVAVVVDADGMTTRFVANEVLVEAANKDELDKALALTGGVVVSDDRPPAPPPESGIDFDPAAYPPTSYVIRVDPAKLDTATLAEDAKALGYEGEVRISSEDGAKLIALIAKGARAKVPVAMNFLMEPNQAMLLATQEHPNVTSGFDDGFTQTASYSATSPEKSGAREAWQFVAAHGIARRTRIAIIDGGFWMQPNGDAQIAAGGTDFPTHPLQYDFQNDDYIADSPNPASCTGGTPCPWHGNGAAGVATGFLSNQYGGAGTGGQVADPLLFHVDLSNGNVKRAVRTAKAWSADVISMSFGGYCSFFCAIGRVMDGYYKPIVEARDAGILVVASAGNDGRDVLMNTEPCIYANLCIGMLQPGTNTRDRQSNFGLAVLLFAPTRIVALPDGRPGNPLVTFGGTSAATPFVSGVAAMMKAMNPALTGDQMARIFVDTAWTDSSDTSVKRYVNALAAVRAAADQKLPADDHEPNDAPAAAKPLAGGATIENRTIHAASDRDVYRLSLADYSRVDLKLTHTQGIGALRHTIEPAGALGEPEGATRTSRPNEREYHADVLPPGDWLFTFSAPTATLYRIELKTAGNALAPDGFERNDTATTAAMPAMGINEHRATIHATSDIDWYEFDVPPKVEGTEGFSFNIRETDRPIVVEVHDATGILLSTRTVAGGTLASIKIPPGIHRVKVVAAAPTRYVFSGSMMIDRSRFRFVKTEIRELPTGWPGVYERILLGGEGLLAVVINSKVRRIELRGPVRGVLLDADGKELARGTPIASDHARLGEQIDLAGIAPGTHALRITRAAAELHGDDTVEVDGAVPYQLLIGTTDR
jgi:subtilisin family serine protease